MHDLNFSCNIGFQTWRIFDSDSGNRRKIYQCTCYIHCFVLFRGHHDFNVHELILYPRYFNLYLKSYIRLTLTYVVQGIFNPVLYNCV